MGLYTRSQWKYLKRILMVSVLGLLCCILLYDISWTSKKKTSISYKKKPYTSDSNNVTKIVVPPTQDYVSLRRSIHDDMTQLRGKDALDDYCNSPRSGNEGKFTEGFKLKMVTIFIRHGDRTSINLVPNFKQPTYNCDFTTWYTGSNSKFRSFPQRMQQLSSANRPKNYFSKWALYPNQKTCKESLLTSRGALQHLQLGQHFYESYKKHSHLFEKPSSNKVKNVYVKSTTTFRTYQSARCDGALRK